MVPINPNTPRSVYQDNLSETHCKSGREMLRFAVENSILNNNQSDLENERLNSLKKYIISYLTYVQRKNQANKIILDVARKKIHIKLIQEYKQNNLQSRNEIFSSDEETSDSDSDSDSHSDSDDEIGHSDIAYAKKNGFFTSKYLENLEEEYDKQLKTLVECISKLSESSNKSLGEKKESINELILQIYEFCWKFRKICGMCFKAKKNDFNFDFEDCKILFEAYEKYDDNMSLAKFFIELTQEYLNEGFWTK